MFDINDYELVTHTFKQGLFYCLTRMLALMSYREPDIKVIKPGVIMKNYYELVI